MDIVTTREENFIHSLIKTNCILLFSTTHNTGGSSKTPSADSNRSDNKGVEMSDTEKNIRDRLGLWGLSSESEVPGSISGLNRLKTGRYSKVC